MGRYEPLRAFLDAQAGDRIQLTFQEVENILSVALPASKRYPAWWSNNPSNNPMTKVWLAAGFVTEQVDTAGERLVFRRAEADRPGLEEAAQPFRTTPVGSPGGSPQKGWLAELRAELAGTVTFAPGFDPTEPTGEIWDAERE